MLTKDSGMDAYTVNARSFAQTPLNFSREAVHSTSPDAMETIKWSVLHFEKLPPSHRKEYINRINKAKTYATRDKRIALPSDGCAKAEAGSGSMKKNKPVLAGNNPH